MAITTADAHHGHMTTANIAADEQKEAISLPSNVNMHGAIYEQSLDGHESRSAAQMDPIDTMAQDNPTKAARDDIEDNMPTEIAEETQPSALSPDYKKFMRESDLKYLEYGRRRRNALLLNPVDSEAYHAAVSKIGAEYRWIMSGLIKKYAAVEEVCPEFEESLADAEVFYRQFDRKARGLFVDRSIFGLIIGLAIETIGLIIGVSCA